MRILLLLISIAGAYALLRGWHGAPGMLLRSCLAIATLVAGLAYWSMGKRNSLPRMSCLRNATWLDYLSLSAAIIFTEACFVVFTSTLAAPAQELVDTFHSHLNQSSNQNNKQTENNEPSFNGHTSGNWLFNRSLERDLPPNSNHKPSNKPEVFVEFESSTDARRVLESKFRLRAFAMSRFNGTTWSAARKNLPELRSPIFLPRDDHSLVTSEPITYTVYHAVSPTGQNLLTTYHGATSSDLSSLTPVSDAIYLLPTLENPATGYTYSATSRPVNLNDLTKQNPEVAETTANHLSIPINLAPRIQEMAELFRHENNLLQQLVELRSYLQQHYQYSLETTNASQANPIENFLYLEKRGYCEHFATATALICRALGIPSRIAYGWSGGRLYTAQNMFVYRAKDAHAWTEIKLKGYGWVVFDTTPPDNNAVPEPHKAPEGETPPDPESEIFATTQEGDPEEEMTLAALKTNIPPGRLTSALIVIGLSCLAFLTTRYFKKPQVDDRGRPMKNPIPGYMQAFKVACSFQGQPMPTGRTLRQHIHSLENSSHPPTFAAEILHYHYGVLYGNLSRNQSQEKSLIRSITNWQQQSKVN